MKLERLATDWRMLLLAVVLIASVVAVAPTGDAEGMTALNFGLELDGGTRVQLSAVGAQATVETLQDPRAIEDNVSTDLGVPVRAFPDADGGGVVEARGNVTTDRLASALRDRGLAVEETERSVTQETLSNVQGAIQTRLDQTLGAGAGATVSLQSNILTGDDFIVVEVPGERENESSVTQIIRTQGRFQITVENGTNRTDHVVYGEEIVKGKVSRPLQDPDVSESQAANSYYVSFELTDEGATQFREKMLAVNATTERLDHQLVMLFNDEQVFRGPLAPSLARGVRDGTWQGGGMRVTGLNESQGRIVSVSLRSGALPTPVSVVSSSTISPRQGEQFKTFSLIIGLLAVFAVGFAIFVRYRDVRVAVPMVFTGVAEVVALLGFAAVFNFNLDLSHIAGLIAVIGTGVDDLVIIADEVLERGEVRSSDLYRKRLKRAFIIIGMAAITTIGAMLPLAYLALGQISGFAIITIVGVLIGVLVTRPAYGSLLRELITDT